MDQLAQSGGGLTPNEITLIINNSLLEQEKRITNQVRTDFEKMSTSIGTQLTEQNKTYVEKLLAHENRITTAEGQLKLQKVRLYTVTTVASAIASFIGGLLGFFVAQLT